MTKEEAMQKKRWLWRYQKSRTLERQLRQQIAEERGRATATTKALTPVTTFGCGGNKIEDAVCRIAERQEKLYKQIIQTELLRDEIESAIDSIESDDIKSVLRERYIIGTPHWWQIANALHMSERWAKKLHNAGIEKMCTPVPF